MQYQIVLRQRNIPDQELLDDLKRVAVLLGNVKWVTYVQYRQHGKVSPNTIKNRFGSWEKALEKAGFSATDIHHKRHWNCPSKQALIADIQAVAKHLNVPTITSTLYEQYGKYGNSCARTYFGSWANVVKAAGLAETGYHTAGITDAELFEDIANVWFILGKQPSIRNFKGMGLSKYGATTYIRHFGSWNNALLCFAEAMRNADTENNPKNDPQEKKTKRNIGGINHNTSDTQRSKLPITI